MVKFENVEIRYGDFVAINDLNLEIKEGEFFTFLGPSGCGKTTSLRALVGFITPSKGKVIVAGKDVTNLPVENRNIGMVFQSYALFPTMTVYENIAFALEVVGMPRKQIRKRVFEVLDLVDLKEKARSYPDELSGGQQQRVTIGRAIANTPKVLIADEPTGNLDPEKSLEIILLLEKINKKLNTTIMMVTHDKVLVDRFKKRTIMLDKGYVIHDSNVGGYKSL
jgi:cell division transport system ATP-binding protein